MKPSDITQYEELKDQLSYLTALAAVGQERGPTASMNELFPCYHQHSLHHNTCLSTAYNKKTTNCNCSKEKPHKSYLLHSPEFSCIHVQLILL